MTSFLRALRVAVTAIALAASVGAAPAHADVWEPAPPLGQVYTLQLFYTPWDLITNRKCVEVYGWSTSDVATVDQYSCHYGNNQRWLVEPVSSGSNVVYLENINSGKCMDVSGGSQDQGAAVVQYSCNFGANQLWYFSWWGGSGGAYAHFINVNSGMCLSVDGYNTDNLRRMTQNPCYDWAANQKLYPVSPPS